MCLTVLLGIGGPSVGDLERSDGTGLSLLGDPLTGLSLGGLSLLLGLFGLFLLLLGLGLLLLGLSLEFSLGSGLELSLLLGCRCLPGLGPGGDGWTASESCDTGRSDRDLTWSKARCAHLKVHRWTAGERMKQLLI